MERETRPMVCPNTQHVDGNHYFWYRNTYEGDVVPADTNQDGQN